MAKTDQQAYEFVMSFVEASDKYKDQFVGKWEEILQNFMVQPDSSSELFDSPYARRNSIYRPKKGHVILKDPETHRLVMTYASKLVRSMFGDTHREYVQARPTGYEDAVKAQTTTRLLRYAFSLPGVFRTFVEATVDMILFGTSIVEVGYSYLERETLVRSVESQYGMETSTESRLSVPYYDDVVIRPIDINCFYPDPSRYRIQEMSGAAKEFRMNAIEARKMAQSGIYSSAAVETAIAQGSSDGSAKRANFRRGIDQPEPQSISDFVEMVGYEYWGEVPFDNAGSRRSVVTILNNVVVRNEPYPLADPYLPFHAFVINPVQGRFYGISPAEVVRFDQSMADAIKILLAEAIIRQVHPPIAFDPDADVDIGALKTWKPDALIAARGGPNSVGTVRYDANVQNDFAMLQGLKVSIQETSGALGAIQGEAGPDRESASVGMQRVQMAMDRPELAAMVIENDVLPCIGVSILRRYQQFMADTEDLKRRIGDEPESAWLGDIMGEFDVSFVGSRMMANRQTKLQAFDRLISYAQSVPAFQAILPNQEIAQYVIGDLLELPAVAAKIGNPQAVLANILAMKQLGPGGAGNNGVPTSPAPTDMPPAQLAGGPA